MYFKILNLLKENGNADYKTLDILKIVIGSQVYDNSNNIAYIEYNESYSPHSDLVEITQSDYDNAKIALLAQEGLTLEERVMSVEQTLNTILLGGI